MTREEEEEAEEGKKKKRIKDWKKDFNTHLARTFDTWKLRTIRTIENYLPPGNNLRKKKIKIEHSMYPNKLYPI